MNRRAFLFNSAAAVYTAGRTARAQGADKLEQVSVMTSYYGTRMPDVRDHGAPKVKKDLDLRDFPDMMADHFHIHNVEVQQMYFPADGLSAYLTDFRNRLRKAKSRVTNMPLEFDDQGHAGHHQHLLARSQNPAGDHRQDQTVGRSRRLPRLPQHHDQPGQQAGSR